MDVDNLNEVPIYTPCKKCDGSGLIWIVVSEGSYSEEPQYNDLTCPDCNGTGKT